MNLEPHQTIDIMLRRKAVKGLVAMLVDPTDQMRSDAGVKRPVAATRHDVDHGDLFHGTQSTSFVTPAKAGAQSNGRRSLRLWAPAFAGVTVSA
jgi:hypothetical protein